MFEVGLVQLAGSVLPRNELCPPPMAHAGMCKERACVPPCAMATPARPSPARTLEYTHIEHTFARLWCLKCCGLVAVAFLLQPWHLFVWTVWPR